MMRGRCTVTSSADGPVVAVIVTHDRRELLAQSLQAVLKQGRPAEVVVVVDNASTDGTSGWLGAEHPGCDVVTLTVNVGGAGGFAVGLDRALGHHQAGAVWLLDDDTIPQRSALEALLTAKPKDGEAVLVASRVLWEDGRDHPMNTARALPWLGTPTWVPPGCSRIRSASFVSILVDGDAARRTAPPIADYFLWNDDFEFTTRLLRGALGLRCQSSVVLHRTRHGGGSEEDPGSRFFFEVRNKVWLFSRSGGLSPVEKIAYGLATVLRWCRTLARSRERRRLLAWGLQGAKAGLRAAPRPNEVVLAGVRS